jgi:hypothetical protein
MRAGMRFDYSWLGSWAVSGARRTVVTLGGSGGDMGFVIAGGMLGLGSRGGYRTDGVGGITGGAGWSGRVQNQWCCRVTNAVALFRTAR